MSPTPAVRMPLLLVSVTDQAGRAVRARGLARWLQSAAPGNVRGEVVVALVPDRIMRRLNRTFAGADRVTDVLSFSGESVRGRNRGTKRGTDEGATGRRRSVRGDIVIATGRAARQARDARHAVGTEFRVLALHGLLHLLGYDHHTDDGTMARLERRLRRRSGLREGLIERANR